MRGMGILKLVGVGMLTTNSLFLKGIHRPVADAGSNPGTVG